MRIISKFHDYYDTAMGVGIDNTRIFNRNREPIDLLVASHPTLKEIEDEFPVPNFERAVSSVGLSVRRVIIGFCGKIYIGYDVELSKSINNNYPNYKNTLFNIQDLEEFYNVLDPKGSLWYNFIIPNKRNRKFIKRWNRWTSEVFEEFRDRYNETTNLEHLFLDYNTPIFTIVFNQYGRNAVFDPSPCLKDFNMGRKFDAYRAYQEIDMYMSGVLGSVEKEPVDISDTHMRDAKGFDNMSFKKAPTKRR